MKDDEVESFEWVADESVSEHDLINYECASDFLTGLVDAAYNTGDTEEFVSCLEELCAMFNVDLPPSGLLKIHEYLHGSNAGDENLTQHLMDTAVSMLKGNDNYKEGEE